MAYNDNTDKYSTETEQAKVQAPPTEQWQTPPPKPNPWQITYGGGNQFTGFDFGRQQGNTFSASNPAEGAKYVAGQWLAQNNIDPNSQWASGAVEGLNKLYGSNVFSANGGQRISYGDEFIDSTKQPGTFFWGSNGPGSAGPGAGPGGATPGSNGGLVPAGGSPQDQAMRDQLVKALMERAGQTLDPNNPVIRAQADAFSADQTRASREAIQQLAEAAGPNANISGQVRLINERAGQASGSFEANLMAQELEAQRQEIAQALASEQNLLTEDQRVALQRELAYLNDATQRYGISSSNDLSWRKALMDNDQFNANLGLQAEDRASYWDAIRSGLIGG